eukprot:TRINITY_DN6938_c0_g1_i1.p1 TRINITY_DN6938_c0_g1~~TRINITY_DN6938_c0_g1_i1.p1  ORF type:complete len:327 (+),score=29.90 TRINITY_DN6938_c0_g1_i1:43-1023(+)
MNDHYTEVKMEDRNRVIENLQYKHQRTPTKSASNRCSKCGGWGVNEAYEDYPTLCRRCAGEIMKQAELQEESLEVTTPDPGVLQKAHVAHEWNRESKFCSHIDSFSLVFLTCSSLSGQDFLLFTMSTKHAHDMLNNEKLWHCLLWRDWLSPTATLSATLSPTISPSPSPTSPKKQERFTIDSEETMLSFFPLPENIGLTSSLSGVTRSSEPDKYRSLYTKIAIQFHFEKRLEGRQLCNVQYYCKQRQSQLHYQKYLHHCMDADQCNDFSSEHRKYFLHNVECSLHNFCHFHNHRKYHDELSLHPCKDGPSCPSKSSWIHNLYYTHK